MSPRRSPSSASQSRPSSPYNVQSRQASAQPTKKKREQFSACGACRMRRVRCDLKDVQPPNTGQFVSCSNCRERGLKCVDEFAEVKAVKLLRRGRRLQQAEAVYGKVPPEEAALRSVTPPPSVIPRLAPEFFSSAFFWRLQIQRPILEPVEFRQRYEQFTRGDSDALQVPGQLVAMALVVWAASFGVNEYGVEENDTPSNIRQRKEHVNDMLQELLYLIDLHGILRKASWDGVRLLLLLLPLTQEIQSPMDRLVMYEATLSQIYNLCSLGPVAPVSSGHNDYIDALVRARIFWYGHVVDGVTSALRGGRILLSDDDLTSFEVTLPSRGDDSPGATMYGLTFRYMGLPIQISSLCRDIHAALTGPKARQREEVKEDLLQYVWDNLDRCWKELDGLRNVPTGDIIDTEDMERFIHGWQIFIFECHNVIREALKQRLVSQPPHDANVADTELTLRYERILRLHDKAKVRCQSVVRDVVAIIQRNLGTSFFQYDAALVRDGCFFAAFLLAGETGSGADVEACLQALGEMRWAYSKSDERMNTVRMVWQSRVQQTRSGRTHSTSPMDVTNSGGALGGSVMDPSRRQPSRAFTIPPLTIPKTSTLSRPSSAPNTAGTTDGSWPSTISGESSQASASGRSLHDSPLHPTAYLGSPSVGGMTDGQMVGAGVKGPGGLVAGSSAMLPPPSIPSGSSGASYERAMGHDQGYYYPQYQYDMGAPGPSSQAAGSLTLPAYHHELPYALDAHAGPSILPASSNTAPGGNDCGFPTNNFYQ